MRAIVVTEKAVEVQEVKQPEPKPNEVLVKIQATSVTAAATMMRTGKPYFGRLFTGISRPKVKTPGYRFSWDNRNSWVGGTKL